MYKAENFICLYVKQLSAVNLHTYGRSVQSPFLWAALSKHSANIHVLTLYIELLSLSKGIYSQLNSLIWKR